MTDRSAERHLCRLINEKIDSLIWQLTEGGNACKADPFYASLLVQLRFIHPLLQEGTKRPDSDPPPPKPEPGTALYKAAQRRR